MANVSVGKHPLPDGWHWVRLGEVCMFNPRRPELRRSDDELTTFVPMAAVDEAGRGISRAELKPFAEIKRGYTYFGEGDVLFAKITPCMQNGKHAIARNLTDGIGFGSTEFHVIRPGPTIVREWVHLFVLQPWVLQEATAHFSGAVGQQRLPEAYLSGLEIPLPPLAEQKRIAAILNDQMSAIERARAAAETRLEAAKALPAAYLRQVFESEEAESWPRKRLGEVCRSMQYGLSLPMNDDGRGYPVIRMNNIKDGTIDINEIRYVEVEHAQAKKFALEKGDILVNRTNSAELVGKSAVFDREGDQVYVFASYLIRLALLREVAVPHYVAFALNSRVGREYVERTLRRAIGQANINSQEIAAFEFPLPPVARQERLAAQVGDKMTAVKGACRALEEQLDTINKLPAALLRRAFSGGL
ncbi:MAG: restriction endonuclease subunit S [Chloroflexi bacterium]|nr:restriction endonuclease subunit S [Chloroflexota bacterium]